MTVEQVTWTTSNFFEASWAIEFCWCNAALRMTIPPLILLSMTEWSWSEFTSRRKHCVQLSHKSKVVQQDRQLWTLAISIARWSRPMSSDVVRWRHLKISGHFMPSLRVVKMSSGVVTWAVVVSSVSSLGSSKGLHGRHLCRQFVFTMFLLRVVSRLWRHFVRHYRQ